MYVKKVAILGATSHVAKGLIYEFSKSEEYCLFLFVRNKQKMEKFLEENSISTLNKIVLEFSELKMNLYDVIINCVGVGTPSGYINLEENILTLNEKYDNLVLEYIRERPTTKYIYLSSGAVYGKEYKRPIDEETTLNLAVNCIEESDYYLISKIYTEAKHRALKNYSIVDIRLFSYFSSFVDIDANYLTTEMIKAVISKEDFITNSNDIARDYISSGDLFQIITKIIMYKETINDYFDTYSKRFVRKSELLNLFNKKYGLKIKYTDSAKVVTVTGTKSEYYSLNRKLERVLGFVPTKSSEECIEHETDIILLKYKNMDGRKNEPK